MQFHPQRYFQRTRFLLDKTSRNLSALGTPSKQIPEVPMNGFLFTVEPIGKDNLRKDFSR